MHKATTTYAKVAQETLIGRELEAHVLLKSAARLQNIQENWDNAQSELDAALLNNRRLWTVLVSATTDPSNPLPNDIKNNIANLALFIFNRTLDLSANPQKERIDVLITINRQIAAGLRAKADAS
jgi:flagellar protein FlaF